MQDKFFLEQFNDIPSVNMKFFKVKLSSPEVILANSNGHIIKPETINYRTFKPERGGLFCAKIFGPIKDYECLCGKYRRLKHRGVICEKCGVEVISSKVRRTRSGHIELVSPVAHPWYSRSVPNPICSVLGLKTEALEKILSFERFIVLDVGVILHKNITKHSIITEDVYKICKKISPSFKAKTGAAVIRILLEQIDIQSTLQVLKNSFFSLKKRDKIKAIKKIKILESFKQNNLKLEWMILTILPVLPPDLRPLVQLDDGKFASSDLNDLYRCVVNRNNRLKKLTELDAPVIILKNERRMLQDAVNALLDNSKIGYTSTSGVKRPLKSLTEILKGKEGRFRQNLLGKRVDYSGRTVIVSGPKLKLHQCGIPKQMALELFKPFIYHTILFKGFTTTIKSAKIIVEKENVEILDILAEIVYKYPIILNRAPTLHRLGIQAFEPILIDGKALELHPLVCQAFNADFDGDQMAIHIPLSIEAQLEARVLLLSIENILSSANSNPTIVPTKEILLGLYYLTATTINKKINTNMLCHFHDVHNVVLLYETRSVSIHEEVFYKYNDIFVKTTVGRLLLFSIAPTGFPFKYVNMVFKKKEVLEILSVCYTFFGKKKTIIFADALLKIGFRHATLAGLSLCLDKLKTPYTKKYIITIVRKYERFFRDCYQKKLISSLEYNKQINNLWAITNKKITRDVILSLRGTDILENDLHMMFASGARGSALQILQLAGMRGLIAKPDGSIFPIPIISNFKEGLTIFEYFISTHGARKGLADTSLKTANSGYLTRKLVDVAQQVVILERDCCTNDGMLLKPEVFSNKLIPVAQQIFGRTIIKNELSDSDRNLGIMVRTPILCKTYRGVCAKCYGLDLSTRAPVELGTAIGVIAAQSLGEPGTQLTMRTFHTGGVVVGEFMLNNIQAENNGFIRFHNVLLAGDVNISRDAQVSVLNEGSEELERYNLDYGAVLRVSDGCVVRKNKIIAQFNRDYEFLIAESCGFVSYKNFQRNFTFKRRKDFYIGLCKDIITYIVPKGRPTICIDNREKHFLGKGYIVLVKNGDYVKPGTILARLKRTVERQQDITQGLLKIADVFESRLITKKTKLFAENSGFILCGKQTLNLCTVYIVDKQTNKVLNRYLLPKQHQLFVDHGVFVEKGDYLRDSVIINQQNLLRSKGCLALLDHIRKEVQSVFLSEGVSVHDKHIEVIVRQMLQHVTIKEDTKINIFKNDVMMKNIVEYINSNVNKDDIKKINYVETVMGISKTALRSKSFLSAASFQESQKILANAAIEGRVDFFVGLKENVMVGNLIPCGTGFSNKVYKEKFTQERQFELNKFLIS